jgi:hypothetical protein
VTRKEEEEEEGKDVGTRDQTASGTGALKRDEMQRGRKEETEKSVALSLSLSLSLAPKTPSRYLFLGGGKPFFFGAGVKLHNVCFFSFVTVAMTSSKVYNLQ